MMNDVFTPEAFSLQSLTAAMNEVPFTPSLLARLGIFGEEGIATLDAAIEFEKGVISLVDVKPRSAPAVSVNADKRRIYSFRVPHLPQTATLMADSVQGVREFGTESSAQNVERQRNKRLLKMRRQLDYTIEAHRLSAVKGLMFDANGNQLNLYTQFGVVQQTIGFALPTAATKVRSKCFDAIELVEAGLDGVDYAGLSAVCGSSFWKELIEHASVRDTFLNWQAAAELRGKPLTAFEFGGIVWERYRGTAAVNVGTDDAWLIPTGVDEMFITRFAPANYMETVNTVGLPYYAKAEPLPMNKGMAMESQTNVLNLCSRPAAVLRLTKV